MHDITSRNFGYLIAYILPGFIALWALKDWVPVFQTWLSAVEACENMPTVAGFLYVTMASLGLGMAISAVRWVVVDGIHHYTGLKRPEWDDAKLQANLNAFEIVVEHHYRYYQFYANSLISVLMLYAGHRMSESTDNILFDLTFFTVLITFWLMSRDTLRKYYRRASQVLKHTKRKPNHGKRKSPSTQN